MRHALEITDRPEMARHSSGRRGGQWRGSGFLVRRLGGVAAGGMVLTLGTSALAVSPWEANAGNGFALSSDVTPASDFTSASTFTFSKETITTFDPGVLGTAGSFDFDNGEFAVSLPGFEATQTALSPAALAALRLAKPGGLVPSADAGAPPVQDPAAVPTPGVKTPVDGSVAPGISDPEAPPLISDPPAADPGPDGSDLVVPELTVEPDPAMGDGSNRPLVAPVEGNGEGDEPRDTTVASAVGPATEATQPGDPSEVALSVSGITPAQDTLFWDETFAATSQPNGYYDIAAPAAPDTGSPQPVVANPDMTTTVDVPTYSAGTPPLGVSGGLPANHLSTCEDSLRGRSCPYRVAGAVVGSEAVARGWEQPNIDPFPVDPPQDYGFAPNVDMLAMTPQQLSFYDIGHLNPAVKAAYKMFLDEGKNALASDEFGAPVKIEEPAKLLRQANDEAAFDGFASSSLAFAQYGKAFTGLPEYWASVMAVADENQINSAKFVFRGDDGKTQLKVVPPGVLAKLFKDVSARNLHCTMNPTGQGDCVVTGASIAESVRKGYLSSAMPVLDTNWTVASTEQQATMRLQHDQILLPWDSTPPTVDAATNEISFRDFENKHGRSTRLDELPDLEYYLPPGRVGLLFVNLPKEEHNKPKRVLTAVRLRDGNIVIVGGSSTLDKTKGWHLVILPEGPRPVESAAPPQGVPGEVTQQDLITINRDRSVPGGVDGVEQQPQPEHAPPSEVAPESGTGQQPAAADQQVTQSGESGTYPPRAGIGGVRVDTEGLANPGSTAEQKFWEEFDRAYSQAQ